MNRKKYPITNIGTALILVVFIILSMVTFAALSVITANHDSKLTEKIADRTSAYYHASGEAEALLSQIDRTIKEFYFPTGEPSVTPQSVAELTNLLSEIPGVTLHQEETLTLSYTIPIDDTHALSVLLALSLPAQPNQPAYQILSWQEIMIREWKGDTKINLIQ